MAKAKSQKPVSCHFVAGSDEVGVKRAAKALSEKLAPGADAFGMEIIDGAVDGADAAAGKVEAALGAVMTLPFLGGKKLVWLKSAAFLADTVTGRSEAVLAALEKLADALENGLPEGVEFLMSAPGADKRRSAYKRFVKVCETEVVDMPDFGFRGGEEALIEWTGGLTRERGLKLNPGAVETLAARVGLDTAQMASELDKLETAFGKSTPVDADAIRELVPQTREGGIFDLSGAVLRRDLPLALDTLAQLFRQGEKGVGILLAAIVPTVRNLVVMKDLMRRHRISPGGYATQFAAALGRLPEEETSHLPRKKDGGLNAYPLSLAASHASNFTLAELVGGFRACATAGQQLFSGTMSDDVILARLLLGMLSRGEEPPPTR
ncbi:MAG: DNA polymerase III subunit delta [Terrimicrobiaceae bacterium]